jgi:hypothetical protein
MKKTKKVLPIGHSQLPRAQSVYLTHANASPLPLCRFFYTKVVYACRNKFSSSCTRTYPTPFLLGDYQTVRKQPKDTIQADKSPIKPRISEIFRFSEKLQQHFLRIALLFWHRLAPTESKTSSLLV